MKLRYRTIATEKTCNYRVEAEGRQKRSEEMSDLQTLDLYRKRRNRIF